jgi:hypothetical protein
MGVPRRSFLSTFEKAFLQRRGDLLITEPLRQLLRATPAGHDRGGHALLCPPYNCVSGSAASNQSGSSCRYGSSAGRA